MSLLGLVCLALGWSAALWLLATALCALLPSPKMAQAIWRGAAALMFAAKEEIAKSARRLLRKR